MLRMKIFPLGPVRKGPFGKSGHRKQRAYGSRNRQKPCFRTGLEGASFSGTERRPAYTRVRTGQVLTGVLCTFLLGLAVVQRVLRTQYRDVSADLSLGRLRTVRVYVVGEVVSPGAYDISSLSTPLNALFAAGGITPRGSLRHLRHSRGRQLVEEVDAYDLLLHGIRGDMKNLENGDTLLVPPVGPQVSVDGMVRRPAVYELRGSTNLGEALDLAGGGRISGCESAHGVRRGARGRTGSRDSDILAIVLEGFSASRVSLLSAETCNMPVSCSRGFCTTSDFLAFLRRSRHDLDRRSIHKARGLGKW